VGGLRYLLSTNTVNFEFLLPGVFGAETNEESFVNGAWRPGVGKITFNPHPVDLGSGTFQPVTIYFTDTYVSNGISKQQQMMRVVSQPDFLFKADDLSPNGGNYTRTGTSNWLNYASQNGNVNGAGPGLIVPPVQIVFNRLGRTLIGGLSEDEVQDFSQIWGSFDGSTNPPVAYPVPQGGTNQNTLCVWLGLNSQPSFVWKQGGLSGAQFALQTSTNLATWTTLFAITNNGSANSYFNSRPTSQSRFYRLIPQ
jgi:hypothetical protein